MRLLKAILLRLVYGVLSLLFISLVTFFAGSLSPFNAAQVLAGEKASPEAVHRKEVELGLDQPWPVQYGRYVMKAAQGDLGQSYFNMNRPVKQILAEPIRLTMTVAVAAILLASIIGLLLGTIAAIYRSRAPDTAVLTVSTLGVTIPNFVLLPLLVYLFANVMGQLPGTWIEFTRHDLPLYYGIALPVIVLAARPMALLTRLTRASMIDTLQQEFIKTAIAKGVPPARLILKHALRNAILPVIAAIGVNFGYLLTGSFVVETAYNMPGLGQKAITAIQQRDIPLIQATVLITGALFIAINRSVDILLPLLDPRIREAQV